MDNDRVLAALLAGFAAALAVLGPWRYVWSDPLCVFEPCEPEKLIVVRGIMAPGVVAAGLALAAILPMLLLARVEVGRTVAGVFLGLAIAWSMASAAVGVLVIFGDDLGPGWAPFAAAGACLGALAVLFWRPIRARVLTTA